MADDRRTLDAERPKETPRVERHVVERVWNERLRRSTEADLVRHDHAEAFARQDVDRTGPRFAEEVEAMQQDDGLAVRRSGWLHVHVCHAHVLAVEHERERRNWM